MSATKAKLTIIINIIQTKWNPKHNKFIRIVYGLLQCINKPEKSQDIIHYYSFNFHLAQNSPFDETSL